jgi:hypothetical protein
MTDDLKDPAQLGNNVTHLPAVRAAKAINPNSPTARPCQGRSASVRV